MVTKATEAEFIETWNRLGSPLAVGKALGIATNNIYARRARLAKKGIYLATVDARTANRETEWSPRLDFERRRQFDVEDGTVVLFSDPHWLPDHSPVAHQALLTIIRDLKPQLTICGGDAADGDTISRWDPTRGHHKRFTVREELECVRDNFAQLDALLKKSPRAWTLGNHDVRLSRYIAVKAPELLDMPMTRLEEWAPKWPLSWTVEINAGKPGMTVVRHRNQAGMLHLQAQKAGCHYAHGHLHRINVHTMPTFAGFRYSVDAGSLADPSSEGFDYGEGSAPHCQGFVVLTYRGGELMPPEVCAVINGRAWFRGGWV